MSRIALSLLLLSGINAYAAGPTVTGTEGASAFTAVGTVYTVYAGLAGTSCTGSGVTPCDSCAAANCATAPLCACNKRKINDGMQVRVYLNPESGNTSNAVAQLSDGTTNFPPLTVNNGGSYVDFNWTDICNRVNGNTGGCATITNTQSVTIKIALDNKTADGQVSAGEETTDVIFKIVSPTAGSFDVYGAPTAEGIGGFTPYPGDEKIYVEDLASHLGFPSLSYGTKVKAVRMFISDTDLATANSTQAPLEDADINIIDNGDNLERNIVDGLENDKRYFFRLALVDEAENVVQHFPDTSADASCTLSTAPADCAYDAIPSEVLGLLSKDFNCFVATAAYGTPLEPKLQTFREFRYKVLLPHKWGLEFVKFYYTYGPYAARYIQDKPALRAVARGLLWPLYGFSYLALKIGFAAAFAVSLVLLSTLIGLPWYGVRRVVRRD